MFNYSNKTALVTGASRGIGKTIAMMLAKNGIKVIGVATSKESLKSIEDIENILPFCCDISDENSIEELYHFAKKNADAIDILVNNAGIHMDNILLRMKKEEWQKVLDVNLNGPFYLTKILLKDMIKNKNGRIINISSISGTDGNKGQSNYSASKGGLLAFTKSLAKEVGLRNITVNCIAPGVIETDMISDLTDTVKNDYLDRIPLKKFGKPEDIGKMILFLSSDEASYITGQTFYIDGGISLN
jgi:3-oxoacyl-[acyl-carrier protein] reductase